MEGGDGAVVVYRDVQQRADYTDKALEVQVLGGRGDKRGNVCLNVTSRVPLRCIQLA